MHKVIVDSAFGSLASLEMTKSILDSGVFGRLRNYTLYENDFLQHDFSIQYDGLVMGEVLEHVENPAAFLSKIGAVTTARRSRRASRNNSR